MASEVPSRRPDRDHVDESWRLHRPSAAPGTSIGAHQCGVSSSGSGPLRGLACDISERSDRRPVNFRLTCGQPGYLMFVAAAMLTVTGASISATPTAASGTQPSVTAISMSMPHAYKPVAAPGTTDDYHCTLVNPHVTRNEYIISSKFVAGSDEVHPRHCSSCHHRSPRRRSRKTEEGAAGRVSGYRFRARTRPESQRCHS